MTLTLDDLRPTVRAFAVEMERGLRHDEEWQARTQLRMVNALSSYSVINDPFEYPAPSVYIRLALSLLKVMIEDHKLEVVNA